MVIQGRRLVFKPCPGNLGRRDWNQRPVRRLGHFVNSIALNSLDERFATTAPTHLEPSARIRPSIPGKDSQGLIGRQITATGNHFLRLGEPRRY